MKSILFIFTSILLISCEKRNPTEQYLPEIVLETTGEGVFMVEKNGEEQVNTIIDSSNISICFNEIKRGDYIYASFTSIIGNSKMSLNERISGKVISPSKKRRIIFPGDTIEYNQLTINHVFD